jgi:hypothetical protein
MSPSEKSQQRNDKRFLANNLDKDQILSFDTIISDAVKQARLRDAASDKYAIKDFKGMNQSHIRTHIMLQMVNELHKINTVLGRLSDLLEKRDKPE